MAGTAGLENLGTVGAEKGLLEKDLVSNVTSRLGRTLAGRAPCWDRKVIFFYAQLPDDYLPLDTAGGGAEVLC